MQSLAAETAPVWVQGLTAWPDTAQCWVEDLGLTVHLVDTGGQIRRIAARFHLNTKQAWTLYRVACLHAVGLSVLCRTPRALSGARQEVFALRDKNLPVLLTVPLQFFASWSDADLATMYRLLRGAPQVLVITRYAGVHWRYSGRILSQTPPALPGIARIQVPSEETIIWSTIRWSVQYVLQTDTRREPGVSSSSPQTAVLSTYLTE